MHLIENEFEQSLFLELPPNARDVCEILLSRQSLAQLLEMQSRLDPNEFEKELLADHRTSRTHWPAILQATLLAKATYFLPNKEMSQAQVLYLVKTACTNAGYPLGAYTLADVIEITKQDMRVLSGWLKEMASLLIEKRAS